MKCFKCDGDVRRGVRASFVVRSDGLHQICEACAKGPRKLDNPFRALGCPDAGGGKVAPGVYQWYSKGDG